MKKLFCFQGMRLAPRLGFLITFVLITIVLVDALSQRFTTLPDIYMFDHKWVKQEVLQTAREVENTPAAAREKMLAQKTELQEWFDLSIISDPAFSVKQPPLAEAFAQLLDELNTYFDKQSPAIITARPPHGEFSRRITVRTVIVKEVPVRMRDELEDKGEGDVAISGDLHIYIPLSNGDWLTFRTKEEPLPMLSYLKFVAAPAAGILMILLASAFTARSLIRPLQSLSAAAEKLGRERSIVPLPPMHIAEYKNIANAFGKMQVQVKRFVDERTHMLAAISHDLRTPLTRMRLLAEDMDDGEKRAKVIESLDDMDTMIREYLSFASEDAKHEPSVNVDIVSLVISVCDTLQDTGHAARYQGPNRAGLICQPAALRRALTNIIDNGCKYGGSAAVTLHDGQEAIEITITDQGTGIPEHLMECAFQPFQRIETSRNRGTGGTGLGLSIARDIIHAHGGEVRMANAAAGGLVVTITLPKPAAAPTA